MLSNGAYGERMASMAKGGIDVGGQGFGETEAFSATEIEKHARTTTPTSQWCTTKLLQEFESDKRSREGGA